MFKYPYWIGIYLISLNNFTPRNVGQGTDPRPLFGQCPKLWNCFQKTVSYGRYLPISLPIPIWPPMPLPIPPLPKLPWSPLPLPIPLVHSCHHFMTSHAASYTTHAITAHTSMNSHVACHTTSHVTSYSSVLAIDLIYLSPPNMLCMLSGYFIIMEMVAYTIYILF